jgi:hypothetical protein
MRGQVSAHELARAFHQHCGPDRLQAADTDVINAFARLDVAKLWGDGHVVAADGSQVNTWENNLLAETSIRCGGFGQLAYRHISDAIALFSRFMPCVFSSHPMGRLHVCHKQPTTPWRRCSLWRVGHGTHVVDGAGFGLGVLGVEDGVAGGWRRRLDRGGR